jgi:hypothetical protein
MNREPDTLVDAPKLDEVEELRKALKRCEATLKTATDATSEMLADALADDRECQNLERLHVFLWRARWDLYLSPETQR